jgi:CheY-like chemotaxis protein
MRIAYVEDNPTNLALVERVASMNQHIVVSYTEGEIALLELKREKFDLILMDVELAGDMGGLEVVRNLRAYGLQTPIIAVTAYAMIGDRDKCIDAGCNDYLPKPMPIPQLIAVLDRYNEMVKRGIPTSTVTASVPARASSNGDSISTAQPVPSTPHTAPTVPSQPTPSTPQTASAAPTPPPVVPTSQPTPTVTPAPVVSTEPVIAKTESKDVAVPVETPLVKPEPTSGSVRKDELKS